MSINQLYLINFIVHLLLFLRLPIVFNLDTIKLFYDNCHLLVTFENSLDQDQGPELQCLLKVKHDLS